MANLDNYAEALFFVAKERKEVEPVFKDFDVFSQIIEKNPNWVYYTIAASQDMVYKNIKNLKFISKSFPDFLKVIYHDKLFNNLDEIKKLYFKLADEYTKTAFVEVRVAKKLPQEKEKELEKKIDLIIKNKKVIVNYKVDSNLIRGYKIEYLGLELDRSISTRLEKIFFDT